MIFFNRFRSSWPFILLLLLLLLEILIFFDFRFPFTHSLILRLHFAPLIAASGHRLRAPPRGCTPRAIDDENYLKRLCVIAWHWISSFLWRHIGSPLLLPPTPPPLPPPPLGALSEVFGILRSCGIHRQDQRRAIFWDLSSSGPSSA